MSPHLQEVASFQPDDGENINTRRRPRNSSEDSMAIRQPVKRRKRSGLNKQTFEPLSHKNAPAALVDSHQKAPTNADCLQHSSELHVTSGNSHGVSRSLNKLRPEHRENESELAKNQVYTVKRLSSTPDVLGSTLQTNAWRAEIAPDIGLAVATTHSQAMIWQYRHRNGGPEIMSPIYIDLSNMSPDLTHPIPISILVSITAEPGLLVIMPASGKIAYWESLSAAASIDPHRRRQQSVRGVLPSMTSGEFVARVTAAEARGFILSMNTGRVIHLRISDVQSVTTILIDVLLKSPSVGGGLFNSFRGVFSPSSWRTSLTSVKSWKSNQRGQRYMITATPKGLFTIWDIDWNGKHKVDREVDAQNDLANCLRSGNLAPSISSEANFEVLEMVVLEGEQALRSENHDCHLLVFLYVHDDIQPRYLLVNLTIASDGAMINAVHPIECYHETLVKEKVHEVMFLLAKKSNTAIIGFPGHVILVSLMGEEHNPTSQLLQESNAVPKPFQEVLTLRTDKILSFIGAEVDQEGPKTGDPSIVVAVQGHGLIRICLSSAIKKTDISNDSVTIAQMRIEQAIFFGTTANNIFDFAPRPENHFQANEIEAACINISSAIMSSQCPHIATILPSMEEQLLRRAAALQFLIRHVQNCYPAMNEATRWTLLGHAERLASAQALWAIYDDTLSDINPLGRGLWVDLVDAIADRHKTINSTRQGEMDSVRQYFTYDLWRLEHLLAYTLEIVELVCQDTVNISTDVEDLLKGEKVLIASEIQSVALAAAFTFREQSITNYGFPEAILSDGVVQHEDKLACLTSPFWTSTPAIVPRAKEMIDIVREMAKVLAGIVAENIDRDSNYPTDQLMDRILKTMQALASLNVQQIPNACRVYDERARWLMSRSQPELADEGRRLQVKFQEQRREAIVGLTDLERDTEAIRLAEYYGDMNALFDIMELLPPDSREEVAGRRSTAQRYLKKFGLRWAEIYFSRSLAAGGNSAAELLNHARQFSPHLTSFFRDNQTWSNIGWIHEVTTEQNYQAAARALNYAALETSDAWSCKVMLSLEKLSLLTQPVPLRSGVDLTRDSDLHSLEQHMAHLDVQAEFRAELECHTRSAIDIEAAIQLVVESKGPVVASKCPAIMARVAQDLGTIFAHNILSPVRLIDCMTILRQDESHAEIPASFLPAFRVLYSIDNYHISKKPDHNESSANAKIGVARMSAAHRRLLSTVIWRRCFNNSDWTMMNKTNQRSDSEISLHMKRTALYKTLSDGFRFMIRSAVMIDNDNSTLPFWKLMSPASPKQILADSRLQLQNFATNDYEILFSQDFASHGECKLTSEDRISFSEIKTCFALETERLARQIEDGRLEEWYHGLLATAESSITLELAHQ